MDDNQKLVLGVGLFGVAYSMYRVNEMMKKHRLLIKYIALREEQEYQARIDQNFRIIVENYDRW